jgi:hypothetical protein
MPLVNDDASKLAEVKPESNADDPASSVREEVPEASRLDMDDPILGGSEATCPLCNEGLLPIGYRGWYGWSHPEKPCVAHEEAWTAWSLKWAAKIDRVPSGRVGGRIAGRLCEPSCEFDDGDAGGYVLIRSKGPRTADDVVKIERDYNHRVVWLWEAASKSIFLNSDGLLRVYGKGAVLSSATCPVLLDFGAGFITRDGFESRVAHVLKTKLIDNNLYIEFRWLSHDQAVEEIHSCHSKLFTLAGSSQTLTT